MFHILMYLWVYPPLKENDKYAWFIVLLMIDDMNDEL